MKKQVMKFLSLFLSVLMLLALCACGETGGHKSKISSLSPEYVPIENVGTYDKTIITDELLNQPSSLPDASNQSIPYWTGMVMENKIFANEYDGGPDDRWEGTDGPNYFYEDQFKFASENGFNCIRILYSLTYLSDPDDIMQINESELKQLDEVISWGIQYNLHIMLSITGMPGKWNTSTQEENVESNDEIFTDSGIQKAYAAYMTMLAKRYAGIPSRNLSFELLAEPTVPNDDLGVYAEVLTPVAEAMWKLSPGRVLIVNDVGRQLPEQMAAIGCSLSLHTHIYTVDGSRLKDPYGIDYTGHWPMEYLPEYLNEETGALRLISETAFTKGTVAIYVTRGSISVSADGKTLLAKSEEKNVETDGDYDNGWVSIEIPAAAKEVDISGSDAAIIAVRITQEDKPDLTLATHALYADDGSVLEKMPTIQIRDDGSTRNMDSPQRKLDSQFIEKQYLQEFIDCAKKYNVGFLMTEIGTDTEDLSADEFVAYESEWLKALKENHISWMWNCMENVCAPKARLWPATIVKDSDIKNVKGTPFYYNKTLIDLMKTYQ